MPGMDGIETLEAMKTQEENMSAGVPWVALTANAGENARDEYIAAGFTDYLSKPVDGNLMEAMLKDYLPKEKVILASDEDFEDAKSNSSGSESNSAKNTVDEREEIYKNIDGIDYKEAIKNCGSLDILQSVIEEFAVSIHSKADNIESFASEKDFRNYTVAVHALKSSARLLGAMELSQMAADLEQCGNDENEAEITSGTPQLLTLYRSYEEKLAQALPHAEESDLPEIPVDELEGAFGDMKELLEAYDFDTADGIMKMLSDYRIPDSHKEKYQKVVELMAAVDRDALIELL